MKDDGSGRKIAVHAAIGGIMSQITGAGFASDAVGAGLNEALIKSLKGKGPGTAQIVSAIVGAAAAKVAGGSAAAGASAAATGTKWNYLLEWQYQRMREELSKATTEEEKRRSSSDGRKSTTPKKTVCAKTCARTNILSTQQTAKKSPSKKEQNSLLFTETYTIPWREKQAICFLIPSSSDIKI